MGNVVVAAERLPNLEDYLCFAVYSANLPLHRLLKPLLDEVGLTYPQYLVLIALYDDDHQTVGGLGDKLFLDSSTLTPLLKRMEAMGYVVRQRDPQDERQVRIRLTPPQRAREGNRLSRRLRRDCRPHASGLASASAGHGQVARESVQSNASNSAARSTSAPLSSCFLSRQRDT